MRNRWTIRAWLIASLAVISACAPAAGDFCDVVPGPLEFEAQTAEQIVLTDRASAEQIAAQNAYGTRHCW